MPKRLSFLVAIVGLAAAVALTMWLRQEHEPRPPHLSLEQAIDWDMAPSSVATDPGAAVETILDLRSQFGSVLANSELDAIDLNNRQLDTADDPASFDDILRATAGVEVSKPGNVDAESSELENIASVEPDGLAVSLRATAAFLSESAQQAKETGDTVQQQRFAALATLLRVEADALLLNRR